ncbi:MAG: UvrD-helicase domain-containing protein [Deltaproteobacteria bacterium]|nr:UvrD-helicase domain-containing protein [Deltaproteobacteria bacterium]
MDILRHLNPQQSNAVKKTDGPILILAGAGSGKTRVLTHRIAYLIREKDISPFNILAVTFTNKAAGEMKERLEKILGPKAKDLLLGTFHSTGLRILRKDGHNIGIDPNFVVYDDDDQLALVKLCMSELNINEKSFSPRAILSHINQAKNEVPSAKDYALRADDFFGQRVASVYKLYQEKLRQNKALDFGDLIVEPIKLFREAPAVLEKYQKRFKYILVDEYQDTNRAQYELINLLSAMHKNLCVVGDEDQSIYGWRGADIRNILEFEKDYPNVEIIRLEQNYRSTKNILSAANSVVEKNTKRIGKTLWTENPDGEMVAYQMARDEHHEASLVYNKIENYMSYKTYTAYKDFAIFYRTNAQSRIFEEHFIRSGLPYNIVGGLRFYERREIKDAIAYLKVIANPSDSLSLMRIINTPPRGIGKTTIDRVASFGVGHGLPLFEALKLAIGKGILPPQKGQNFINLVERFRDLLGSQKKSPPLAGGAGHPSEGWVGEGEQMENGSPSPQPSPIKGAGELSNVNGYSRANKFPIHELAKRLLEESSYIKMWEGEKTEEAEARIENLHELISAMRDFEKGRENPSLAEFLDHVALISDIDTFEDKHNRVTLMTLHSAKGLEFPVVFMVGMEEGLFPHSRSINGDSADELEEERRLCYVGMTRAMKKLFLLGARERTIYGESRFQGQSRFIDEIDPNYLEIITPERSQKSEISSQEKDKTYYTEEPRVVYDDYRDYRDNDPWKIGMRIKHPSFGIGIVKAKEGLGEDTKLTVMFPGMGQKKLIVKYASITEA